MVDLGIFASPELWFWVVIYAVITLSLNLEAGITGIPNFGKHLAVIIGAIVAATLPGYLGYSILPGEAKKEIMQIAGTETPPSYSGNYNALIKQYIDQYFAAHPLVAFEMFLATLVVAALLGALVGAAVSYPAARLREDYLAITLLAAAEAMLIISKYAGFLGSTQGLSVPNTLSWIDAVTKNHYISALIVIGLLALASFIYLELVLRSPLGRLLKGVRENETAAQALGKNTTMVKLKTLMVGFALAGMAGALFIATTLAWNADTFNRVSWTFWPWAMMILGGSGNNLGVLIGTAILASARQIIVYYKDVIAPYLPFSPVWLDQLILGSLLILVLMVRPEGILPEKTVYPLPRGRLREIALRHGAPEKPKAAAEKAALEEAE